MIREFRAYDVPNRKYWNNWSRSYLLSLEGVLLKAISGDAGEIEAIAPDPESEKRFIFEQWTGMVDSKGTKIFEGDILKSDDGNYGYGGEYDKTHDGYLRRVVPSIQEMIGNSDWDQCAMSQREVIGNIHDNPELIEPASPLGGEI